MLSILILSDRGENFGLAKHLQESCMVRFWCKEHLEWPYPERVKLCQDYSVYLPTSDIVLSSTDFGRNGDYKALAKAGGLVFGDSLALRDLDRDKVYKAAFLAGFGLTKLLDGVYQIIFDGEKLLNPIFRLESNNYLCEGDKGQEVDGAYIWTSLAEPNLEELEPIQLALSNFKQATTCVFAVAQRRVTACYLGAMLNLAGMLELISEAPEEFLLKLARREYKSLPIRGRVSLAVRAANAPYDWSSLPVEVTYPEKAAVHIWEDRFLWATARGLDREEVRRRVKRTLRNLDMNSTVQYRADF